nr:reverse transcriptase domain-containing protein [Tanacetum cinerariifolium]
VAKVNTSSSTPAISSDVAELKDMVRALLLDKKNQSSAPAPSLTLAPVKAVEPNCVTYAGSGTLPGNTITNPKEDLKGITTRSGVAYQGPTIPTPSKVVKQGTKVTKDQVQTPSSQSTPPVQPLVFQYETLVFEPVGAPVSSLMPNLKPSIPYPSRNKEKLSEMARTPMNEHCLAVILNKLPKKLGDPDKFLFPCEFPGMDECLALADLGASINLMPLFVWEELSLLELTPTYMTLELADRTVSKPIGIAKDVSVKVGVFQFPADFVVVDFEPGPRVPLILGKCFLKTGQALIDVHKGELTLRIGNEAITYNLDHTSRYSTNYNQMMANKIDAIDIACEDYSQEVLGFSDVTASGSPTHSDDPIVSTTSPTLTLFGDSDFLLFEEADAFLGLEDDPYSPKFDPSYYDSEGDILLLKAILNSEPVPPLPNHEQSMPSFKKELKACEAKMIKSSVDEPPEVELMDLPPHLEYAFLEGDNKLPVIIAKELGDEEKSALIKVLKSHKRAIAWKLSDIQGINPEFCTHKILIEEDYKLAVQHQRQVNPKIHDVIKKEVEKLLDAGLIYPISDSPWEKTTFTCPYGTFAYRRMPFGLCSAPGTFQRCMLAIFHDMVEKTMEVFNDDFSVFRNSFENCLSRLDKMLQRCEDTKLCLNWEKSHFMVKEGIVLGHKISKNGIEVDKAKVDVITKLPHPTTVKVHMDHSALKYHFTKKDAMVRLLRWVLLLQEFDFDVIDIKGAENLATDHLSRLENPYENVKAKALPTNDARVVCKFLKSLFARFGAPRAIISDRDTYFCNDQFAKVMRKYGVIHHLSTAYHPQTSGQVEMLERLAGNEYYFFLDGVSGYFQIPIDPRDQEKTTFTCPYGTFAYRRMPFGLCNAPGTFQRYFSKISRPMTHLLEKNTPFVFSKDCIQAFQTLKKKLTEAPILIAPNWDLPFELMCDASDFAIGTVLGQRHERHFKPIHYASKTMNDAETNYTTTEKEMLAVVYAFEKFRSYLIMNKSIVHTDHSALKYLFAKKDAKARLLRWVVLLQEFDFKVLDTKGVENLAADHLSRLENPYENVLEPKEINEKFPLETLSMVTFRGDSSASWFVDFTNYHAGNFIVKEGMSILRGRKSVPGINSNEKEMERGYYSAFT